jgi:hypothetical protein
MKFVMLVATLSLFADVTLSRKIVYVARFVEKS